MDTEETTKRPKYKQSPPEGGWGWTVAIGTFLITMVLSIPGMTFGILLNDTLLTFDTTTSTASWTMSISLGFSSLISPLVTMAIHATSCRKVAFTGGLLLSLGMMLSYFASNIETLFLTYGLLTGVGYGCSRISTAVILGQYFNQRYGVATGIMMAGFSVSRLVFSTVIQFIGETYGLRGAYLITGAMCLHICVGAALFQPVKWHYVRDSTNQVTVADKIATVTNHNDRSKENDRHSMVVPVSKKPQKKYLDLSLFHDESFYVIIASSIPFQVVFIYSTIFLVPLGMDKGFEPMDAAMVQTYKAFGEIVGRLGTPWILELSNWDPTLAYIAMCLINGVAFIAHATCDGYIPFVATAMISAFFCGGIAIQGNNLMLLYVGAAKLPSALGLSALFVGAFVLGAGPFLGFVRDVTGSLEYSFLILAVLQVLSGLVWIYYVCSQRRKTKLEVVTVRL